MSQIKVTLDAKRFEKFLRDAPEKAKRALRNIIYKSAYIVERYAKMDSPVDTGRLRSSIATEIYPMRAVIQPNVDYAIYVHDGTRYITGRPFMKNAADRLDNEVDRLIQDEIKMIE